MSVLKHIDDNGTPSRGWADDPRTNESLAPFDAHGATFAVAPDGNEFVFRVPPTHPKYSAYDTTSVSREWTDVARGMRGKRLADGALLMACNRDNPDYHHLLVELLRQRQSANRTPAAENDANGLASTEDVLDAEAGFPEARGWAEIEPGVFAKGQLAADGETILLKPICITPKCERYTEYLREYRRCHLEQHPDRPLPELLQWLDEPTATDEIHLSQDDGPPRMTLRIS